MPALTSWIGFVRPKLFAVAREAESQAAPIRREAARKAARNGIGTAGRDLEPPVQAEKTKEEATALYEKANPLNKRRDLANELAGSVLGLATSRFGQSIEGGYGSPDRWIRGVRDAVAKQTSVATPAIANALRPLSMS